MSITFNSQIKKHNSNNSQKSHLCTNAGLTAGAGVSAYKFIKGIKSLNSPAAKKYYHDTYEKIKISTPEFMEQMTLEQFAKRSRLASIGIMIGLSAVTLSVGFGFGKCIDTIINKHRAKKSNNV